MAKVKATPEMMNTVATDIGKKLDDWSAGLKAINTSISELSMVCEGQTIVAFNQRWQEDATKFNQLTQLMTDYRNAIVEMAKTIALADETAKNIVKGNQ